MLYNPAVDIPGLFIIFLEGFLQVEANGVQMMTVIQAKEFLFFNTILPYIPPLNSVATDLLLAVDSNTKQAVCCMKHTQTGR